MKIFKIILVIIWMGVIFYFSHQVGEDSKITSGILDPVVKIVFKSEKAQDNAKYFIRKVAHFVEYFILALLVLNVFKDYFTIDYKVLLLVLFICFLYACSDEWHQSFVDGRSGNFIDVIIDTFGTIIYIAIYNIRKFNKEEKEMFKDI